MIKSMTGYGSAKGSAAGFDVSVELKSVNNRYLETSVRLPRSFIFAEDAVKSAVSKHISRGKVDVFVTINAADADDCTVKINKPLMRGYYAAVKEIADELAIPAELNAVSISRYPDVLYVERADVDAEDVTAGILTVLEHALDDYDAMRSREGEKLRDDILGRLVTIEDFVSQVEKASPETVEKYRARLEAKMREILEGRQYDETRIITETAIFADKVAVDEETVRLRSHISQLRQMAEGGSPIGRKMDFLVQEFNREANTIGSKCTNSDIAHVVVDLKSEIEKIREQVQNIE